MTNASAAQIRNLAGQQSRLRDNLATTDTYIANKIETHLWRIAQGAASAAADGQEEIDDFLVTRPWLTINPGESRDEILVRLHALRAELVALTPDQMATLDSRTISRHIDAAKALHR